MVDALTLASDILETTVFFATPGLLWLFLYLFAWESPRLARATGVTRGAVWLLLPGALIGEYANLPVFGWGPVILAVNVGGGLLPVVLAAILLRRTFGSGGAVLLPFTAAFVSASALLLGAVLLLPAGPLFALDLLAGAAAFGIALLLLRRRPLPNPAWRLLAVAWLPVPLGGLALTLPPDLAAPLLLLGVAALPPLLVAVWAAAASPERALAARRVAALLTASQAVVYVTYLTTATVVPFGIVSTFPFYLIAPIATGALLVVAAGPAFRLPARAGLSLGYATATLGVLVGADVLREPPLYATGTSSLLAIGGAGLFDLLYLTGLLALAAAWLAHRAAASRDEDLDLPEPDRRLTPFGALRRSLLAGVRGRPRESIVGAARAVEAATAQAERLLGRVPAARAADGWAGLGAPPWTAGDLRNLEAAARDPSDDPREAVRSWMTARWLLRIARDAGRARYGSLRDRGVAFLVDLALLTAPAVAVWAALALLLPGSSIEVLGSAAFNAAIYGYASYAFAYFVGAELLFGTTYGKRLMGLRVVDRDLRRPGAVPALLRSLPKLIPLTVIALGGGLVTFLLLRGGSPSPNPAGGLTGSLGLEAALAIALFVAVGLALSSAVSTIAISASPESQRLGDYLAGTWVIRDLPPVPAGPAAPPLPPPPPGWAGGRSG